MVLCPYLRGKGTLIASFPGYRSKKCSSYSPSHYNTGTVRKVGGGGGNTVSLLSVLRKY